MTVFLILAGIAFLGVLLTAYLVANDCRHQKVACVAGASCQVVLRSKYSKIMGVPNVVLGLVFYLAVFALSLSIWQLLGPVYVLTWLLQAIIALGALASLILVYIQWRVLKAWCSWCLLSALLNFCLELTLVWPW